tara:strand:+ start:114 stop:470 length:357 start_codon:yes stop_codon:yes gene_type:complete
MDCIRILNLKIPARHGVYDFEKDKDGLFELDAELFLNLNIAGNSDQLCDTVDYGEVVKSIIGIFTSKDCKLIEAIGEDICKSLLANYPISKIHLRIRKPHAPIIAHFDNVEVELVREK